MSKMNKIVKLSSVQSGEFTAQKNLIDFDIMGGRQYDMRRAYINLVGTMEQTDADAATGEGVYNWSARWTNDNGTTNTETDFPDCALVKNVRFTSDQKGTLEDIRRSDVLRTQLKHYTMNEDDQRGALYKKLNQFPSPGNLLCAPNIEFFSTGDKKSRVRDVNVQIPVKDLLELGNADHLPCDKLGNCRMHLELNLDKLVVIQRQGAGTRATQFGNELYTEFDDEVTVGDITSVTTTSTFVDPKYSPYFISQKIKFNSTGAGGAANIVNEEAVIESIEWLDSEKMKLNLSRSIGTIAAGQSYTDIECDGVNAGSISLSWVDAEIVLEETADMEQMDELTYSSFLNEQDAGSGLTSFSRQYGVESECFNLYVCLPDTASGLICRNTAKTQYESFRLRSDNVDLTNRAVDYQSPLYYDRIGMTLLNANLPLRNLTEQNLQVGNGFDARYTTAPHNLIFIGNPLGITPMRKMVQVSIDGNAAGAGVNEIQLYKQVVKSIKL